MNIVITGSTRGIGYGLAEEFLKAGHGVLINGRDRMVCAEVYAKLHIKYPECLIHIYACDVTCYNSLERMFFEANRFFGSVDIWINNAGMAQADELLIDHDKNNIDQVIDLNIKAMVYGTKVAIKGMWSKGGFIYNMEGYGSNDMVSDKMSIYGMSKRALTYFSKSISKEVRGSNVKIGTLSPGMVTTNLLLGSLPKDEETKKKFSKIYNILADKVETVTPFLVKKIISNNKNGISIKWLTNRKVFLRFFIALFHQRHLIM